MKKEDSHTTDFRTVLDINPEYSDSSLDAIRRLYSFIELNGSIKNRAGKAGASHWYTDTEIHKLFELYISGNSKVEYLDAMLATSNSARGNVLSDNLVQFNTARMDAILQRAVVKDRVLIPINLNQNHWALLYIIYSKDAANLPDIYYFDPFGNEVPDELKRVLQRGFSLRSLSDVNIIPITRRVQNDGYNCGPWIVEAARAIAQNGSVPERSFPINLAKIEHMKIIQPDASPDESSQSQLNIITMRPYEARELLNTAHNAVIDYLKSHTNKKLFFFIHKCILRIEFGIHEDTLSKKEKYLIISYYSLYQIISLLKIVIYSLQLDLEHKIDNDADIKYLQDFICQKIKANELIIHKVFKLLFIRTTNSHNDISDACFTYLQYCSDQDKEKLFIELGIKKSGGNKQNYPNTNMFSSEYKDSSNENKIDPDFNL